MATRLFRVRQPFDRFTRKLAGVVIQHRSIRSSALVLVPIISQPIPNARPCPVCKIPHLCKTVHLSLSPTGSAIVSEGVLALLHTAGMPELDVVGSTQTPPPVYVGRNAKPRMRTGPQDLRSPIVGEVPCPRWIRPSGI